MDKQVMIVAIYAHPEGYPPTLNCVAELSRIFGKVILLGRNVLRSTWTYPDNCEATFSSQYYDVRVAERASVIRKILFFVDFLRLLLANIRRHRPGVILVYDPMALFAYFLIIKFVKKPPYLWYHNHDIFEIDKVRRFSIQWWAGKYENSFFKRLDIFSLPSDERKKHFRMQALKGKYFLIPNFPAKKFFREFYRQKAIGDKIKLIYQGAIAKGHGLEEIVCILQETIAGKKLELVLIGVISQPYKLLLESLAKGYGCENQLRIEQFTPYHHLPAITAECHVGIGIHSLQTFAHTSAGKASNKIYEYAAVGLPIIAFDSSHYREHLGKFSWVEFSDLSKKSLVGSIMRLAQDYEVLSQKAHDDFEEQLNFELQFRPVGQYLREMPDSRVK